MGNILKDISLDNIQNNEEYKKLPTWIRNKNHLVSKMLYEKGGAIFLM